MNWIKGGLVAALLVLAMPSLGQADWNGQRGELRGRGHDHNHGPRWSQHRYYYGHHHGRRWSPGRGNALERGVWSGRLSRAEVMELEERQREIARKRYAYLSDGHLSYREREKLRKEFDSYRKKLAHELSDGERRYRR